jgi:hypothetical protein
MRPTLRKGDDTVFRNGGVFLQLMADAEYGDAVAQSVRRLKAV